MDRDYDGWDDERDYDDMFADEMEYGPEDNLSDVEADAMTLRDAGYGTDEDYGYYGE
jgi:flagellum-specific peptidoglycan hydrolase FlgJ